MKRAFPTAALLLLLGLDGLAQESPRRPMTVDDALDVIQVEDALMSPDGEWVFYSTSELDWEKNKRKSTYYKIPAAGGEAYQFIGEAGGSAFQFSPEGTYLSFLRSTTSADAWMQKHVLGVEWEPWKRADEEKDEEK